MFKIGEFSQLGQVSTRMLRHYDKLGLLVPSEVDEWTGYRYYTIDQLARLHRIVALKEMGLSLLQVGELLDGRETPSAENLRGMLQIKQAELQSEMAEMQRRLMTVESRLQRIEQEGKPSPYEFVVKTIHAQPIASVRGIVPHISEMGYFCERSFDRLYGLLATAKIKPTTHSMTLYHTEEFKETDIDVEASVTVAEAVVERTDLAIVLRTLPAHDLVASLIFEGELREIESAVLALLDWIGRNNHVPDGPLREIHAAGLIYRTVDECDIVVELQLPIKPIAN